MSESKQVSNTEQPAQRPIEVARAKSEALQHEMENEPYTADPQRGWFTGSPRLSEPETEALEEEARQDRKRKEAELIQTTSAYDVRINWLLEQSQLGQPLQREAAQRRLLDSEVEAEDKLEAIREGLRTKISAAESNTGSSGIPVIQESAQEYVARMRGEAAELHEPGQSASQSCSAAAPSNQCASVAPPSGVARVGHTTSSDYIQHMSQTAEADREYSRVARIKAGLGEETDHSAAVVNGHRSAFEQERSEIRERNPFAELRERVAALNKSLETEVHTGYEFPPPPKEDQ